MLASGPMSHPFQLTHSECGNPAFFLTKMPGAGEHICAADCITPDGNVPPTGGPMICGSCGEQIGPVDLCLAAITPRLLS